MNMDMRAYSMKPDAVRKRALRNRSCSSMRESHGMDHLEEVVATLASLVDARPFGPGGTVNIGGDVSLFSSLAALPSPAQGRETTSFFRGQNPASWAPPTGALPPSTQVPDGVMNPGVLDSMSKEDLVRARGTIDSLLRELTGSPPTGQVAAGTDAAWPSGPTFPVDRPPDMGPEVVDGRVDLGFVPLTPSSGIPGEVGEFTHRDASDAMLPSSPQGGVSPAVGVSAQRKLLMDRLRKEHILLLDEVLSLAHLEFFEHAMTSFQDVGKGTSTIGGDVSRIHGLKNLQLNGGSNVAHDSLFKDHGHHWKLISFRGRSGVEWMTEIDSFLMGAIGMEDKSQPSSTAIHFQSAPPDDDFLTPGFSLPNYGQFAHLDDFQGLNDDSTTAIAVIAALDNMKSTEVMHSVNGVIPWCWECAPSTSLNVKKGQIFVFLPGGVHKGPDSSVDILKRSLYFAGCNWNIDLEEVTYDEARVQQLYLEDKKITDEGGASTLPPGLRIQDPLLSCCPHAWDSAPETTDLPSWFVFPLQRWAKAKAADLRGVGMDLSLAATVRRAGKSHASYARHGLFDGFDKVFPEPHRREFLGDDGLLNLFVRFASGNKLAYYQSFSCHARNEPQTLKNKIAHGWHVDGHDVQQGDQGGIIIIGLFFGDDAHGTKGFSTAEFKRSTRSRTHRITLKEGQYYIMKESWKNGIHRFQSDVPRTMIRIGYGVASEDGVQWSYAEHKKAKASQSGSTTKKRKATKSFGDIGPAPHTRTSARLHAHEQHTGDARALEPALVEAGASPPRMAPDRREGPRLRRDHQESDEDDIQDDGQVVRMIVPGAKTIARGKDGKFLPKPK